MSFNLCEHKLRTVIIELGRRELPQELNVSKLYLIGCKMLGFEPELPSSVGESHLPTPEETGPFFECPNCKENGLVIYGLCSTCSDSEGGKFQTKLICKICGHEEKSRKHLVTLFQEFGFEFKSGSKKEIGIKTITDEGVK